MSSLITLLNQQLSGTTKVFGWDFDPEKYLRSVCGFVGLKNQSSTCYMNSLLQQFFMMPEFRRGILEAPDLDTLNANSGKDVMTSSPSAQSQTENLLFQLQTLFGGLSLSEKQSFDTLAFCGAYKDENVCNCVGVCQCYHVKYNVFIFLLHLCSHNQGAPINVRVQQDAQEFFNVVCDRLEQRLKRTPEASLLQRLFAGQITNQMLCLGGCNSVRERDEEYYTLSVNVKNKRNLEESLQVFLIKESVT